MISPWLFHLGDYEVLIKIGLCVSAAFFGRWVVGWFE